jgi:hypothetical protein
VAGTNVEQVHETLVRDIMKFIENSIRRIRLHGFSREQLIAVSPVSRKGIPELSATVTVPVDATFMLLALIDGYQLKQFATSLIESRGRTIPAAWQALGHAVKNKRHSSSTTAPVLVWNQWFGLRIRSCLHTHRDLKGGVVADLSSSSSLLAGRYHLPRQLGRHSSLKRSRMFHPLLKKKD